MQTLPLDAKKIEDEIKKMGEEGGPSNELDEPNAGVFVGPKVDGYECGE